MSTNPEKYRPRTRPAVQAIRYDGTYSGATAIVRWVTENSGRVDVDGMGRLLVGDRDREWQRVVPGWYLVLDYTKTFRVMRDSEFESEFEPVTTSHELSVDSQVLIRQAYDNGDGEGITLTPLGDGGDGYVRGEYEGDAIYWGTEVEGVLYSIALTSWAQRRYTVLIGRELVDNTEGPRFSDIGKAKAYIQGLTAK